MLIVVVIIGILAGVLIPRIVSARERASDASRDVKVWQISTAIDMYYSDHGSYPLAAFYASTPVTQTHIAAVTPAQYSLQEMFTLAPRVFAAGQYSSVDMIADKLAPHLSSIPTDTWKGVAAQLDPSNSCVQIGDSFAYATNESGAWYAITSRSESKKGNTNNCLWVVDANNDGGFKTRGVGLLEKNPNSISFDPEEDDPVEWCLDNLTESEAEELESIPEDSSPWWTFNKTIKTNSKKISFFPKVKASSLVDKWCNKKYLYRVLHWEKVPFGLRKLTNLSSFYLIDNFSTSLSLIPMNVVKISILSTSISNLSLPDSLPNLIELDLNLSNVTNIVIPDDTPLLRSLRISWLWIKSITFPQDSSSIGDLSINSTSLTTLNIPYMNISQSYISNNNSLTNIVFDRAIPSLQWLDLKENSQLRSITLPDNPWIKFVWNYNLNYNPQLEYLWWVEACNKLKKFSMVGWVSNWWTANVCP